MKKLMMLVAIMGLSTTMTFAQDAAPAKAVKHSKVHTKTVTKKVEVKADAPKVVTTTTTTKATVGTTKAKK